MNKKLSIYPIENSDLWSLYKKADMLCRSWGAEGGDYSNDEFNSLTPNQQKHLGMNLAFFANSDKIVADNLALNFLQESDENVPEEAKYFYGQQLHNEQCHAEVYGDIIIAYFPRQEEQLKMLAAAENVPAVRKKVEWANKWLVNGNFQEKLIAFAAVEGILFASVFSTIFAYKSMQKKLPGLYWANNEISRDETCHYEFAQYLYNTRHAGTVEDVTILDIILSASEAEQQFVRDCFEHNPEGLNVNDMLNYVQYVTDSVLIGFNLQPHYNAQPNIINDYMAGIAAPKRTNFFEGKTAEYSKLTDTKFKFDDDF